MSSGSTATTPDDAPVQKPKSKRGGHHIRDSPVCDACRLRRVKCNRQGLEACQSCVRKGVNCTTTKTGRKAYKPRTGKRIEEAKNLYGEPAEMPMADLSPPPAPVASTSGWAVSTLSGESVDARLGHTEDTAAFMAALLEDYWANTQNTLIHIHWRIVGERFEQAGRRLDQLHDPTHETLLRVILAVAALGSDCPVLVGPGAPALADLPKGVDLTYFGHRRQEAAGLLRQQALAWADGQGLMRQQSPDALSLMILLYDLQNFASDELRGEGGPFLDACISGLRERFYHGAVETELGEQALLASASWGCAVADACRSAYRGTPFLVQEEELNDFTSGALPLYEHKRPPAERVRDLVADPDLARSGWPVVYLWCNIVSLGRRFAKQVSMPIARTFDFPDEAFGLLLDELADLSGWLRESARAIRGQPVPPEVTRHQSATRFVDAQAGILDSVGVVQQLAYFFKRQLDKFERQRAAGSGLLLVEADRTLDARLAAAKARLGPVLRQVALDVTDDLERQPLRDMVRFGTSACSKPDWLPMLAEALFDMPLDTEGGPAGFTLGEKTRRMQILSDGIKAQTWSWPARAAEVATIESKLQSLLQMQQPPAWPLDASLLDDLALHGMPQWTDLSPTAVCSGIAIAVPSAPFFVDTSLYPPVLL